MLEFIFKYKFSRKSKIVFLYLSVILIFSGFVTCQKDKFAVREYPRLNTLEVTNISTTGAVFNAEIISGNPADIIEYGFTWDTGQTPSIYYNDKVNITGVMAGNQFSAAIHSSLKKNVPYYVRSYIKTAQVLVYGKTVSFLSLGSEVPIVTDFFPKSGTWGDTIKITGKNFRNKNNGNSVKLAGIETEVVSCSDTTIQIIVPIAIKSKLSKIIVKGPDNIVVVDSFWSLNDIELKSFKPDTAIRMSEIITIRGENFHPVAINNSVLIKGYKAIVTEVSAGQLKVKLPDQLISEKYFSVFGEGDISITIGELSAKFDQPLIVDYKSRWTKKKDFPGVPRYSGAGFSIGNKGYFGLGYRYPENYYLDFWEYDPHEDNWTQKPDFPGKGRYGASSFALNSDGYVGLGITLIANDQIHLKDFYKYSPNIEEWTKIADLPGSPRYSAASFVKDGKAFVGTGKIVREDYTLPYDEGIITSDFWSYSPLDEQWNEVQNFPYKTGRAVGLTIGNAGYVYENEKITAYTDNIWMNKCTTTSFPHEYEVSFTIGSSGYIIFGGVNDIFEFDSNVNQIKKISMPVQVACILPAIFVINKKAYFVCGEQNTINSKAVWEFDPTLPLEN